MYPCAVAIGTKNSWVMINRPFVLPPLQIVVLRA